MNWPHKCARVMCDRPAAIALRLNPSTVLPLCAECEARRQRETLLDGDSLIEVKKERLVFQPG